MNYHRKLRQQIQEHVGEREIPAWLAPLLGAVSDSYDTFEGDTTANARDTTPGDIDKWKYVFESAGWGIAISDAEHPIIARVNPAYAKMLGYTKAEMEGMNIASIYDPDERYRLSELIREAHEQGHAEIETIQIHKNGTAIPVSVNVSTVKDPAGKVLYRVANVQDISERKKTQQALQASEERWHLAVHGSGDGLWDWNILTNEVYFSPSWEQMFGYESGTAPGNFETFANLLHPADKEAMMEMADRYLSREIPHYYHELRMIRRDGTLLWTLHRGAARFDEAGNPVRMVGTTADITERKRAEEDLREAKQTAEEASSAKSIFLSRMSHEIRTPLNAILGAADLLKAEPDASDRGEWIRLLKQGGANLLSIINDILELSAVESGRTLLNPTNFNPEDLVRNVVEPLAIIAHQKGLSINTRVDSNVPDFIKADEGKLRQILLNLLGNATKFTDEGQIDVSLRMSTDDALLFEIADTGPGIPEEDRGHIFEPYRKAGRPGQRSSREGSGLGLAITRSFVQLLGGEISLSSVSGKGSTFYFTFPFQPATQKADAVSEETPPDLRDKSILLVDDNEDNLLLIERMLNRLGADQMDLVRGGQQALDFFAAKSYHLVLMDKQMPGVDGLQATRGIRALEKSRQRDACKIIAVTADAFEEDRRACLDAGCDDWLSKPLTIGALTRMLGRHFSSRGTQN